MAQQVAEALDAQMGTQLQGGDMIGVEDVGGALNSWDPDGAHRLQQAGHSRHASMCRAVGFTGKKGRNVTCSHRACSYTMVSYICFAYDSVLHMADRTPRPASDGGQISLSSKKLDRGSKERLRERRSHKRTPYIKAYKAPTKGRGPQVGGAKQTAASFVS